jgi:hypothetical protein
MANISSDIDHNGVSAVGGSWMSEKSAAVLRRHSFARVESNKQYLTAECLQ